MEQSTLRLDNWGIRKVVDTPQGVEILSVSNNRLKALGAITTCISLLELNLSGNKFEEIALLPLAQFRKLRTLNISNNRLRGLDRLFSCAPPPPGAGVEQFPALEDLDVSDNAALADVSPALSRQKLRRLRAVGVAAVCLTCPSYGGLEVLEMDRCSLAIVEHLASLTMLRTLALDGNALLSGSGVLETSHPRLETLRLSSNAIHRSPPLDFPCLTTLDLSQNQLSQLHSFTGAQNITSLSLSGNSLVSLASLAPLRVLRFLDVSNNALIGLDPSLAVAVLPSLQALDMSSNKIEHFEDLLSVLAAARAPLLEHLDLRNNPFTFAFYPEASYSLPRWSWDASATLSALNRANGSTLLDTDTQLELESYRSLIARTCHSLRSLDGILIADRDERARPTERGAQVSPMVRMATAAVQSEAANGNPNPVNLVDRMFPLHGGVDTQYVRESDEVLYSTPRMSAESHQQLTMSSRFPDATDISSIRSDSHATQLSYSELHALDLARRGIAHAALSSPPVQHMSSMRRERSESRTSLQSDNVVRQRSVTTSPTSRVSFDEIPIVATDTVQMTLPDTQTPLLLPSPSLHGHESLGSCASGLQFERQGVSASSARSMRSPTRSALRSVSERNDTDAGSMYFGSDLERRRTSTTSTICGSPPRSALPSIPDERDIDIGSLGLGIVDLERHRVLSSSTICGSSPQSAFRAAPGRCDIDTNSVDFCSVDLDRRRISSTSAVRDLPSTSRPMMSVPRLGSEVITNARSDVDSIDLEYRQIGSRTGTRTFSDQHGYVLEQTCPQTHDSLQDGMITPVAALQFQTPFQSGPSSFRHTRSLQSGPSSFRHTGSPVDPACAEALPRPRGSSWVGTDGSTNRNAETSFHSAVISATSARYATTDPPLQPSRPATPLRTTTREHQEWRTDPPLRPSRPSSPRRTITHDHQEWRTDPPLQPSRPASPRRTIAHEHQEWRTDLPLQSSRPATPRRTIAHDHQEWRVPSADKSYRQPTSMGGNFTPAVASSLGETARRMPNMASSSSNDKKGTIQHDEHISTAFASRNAYLKFLENEIASQRAFMKLQQGGRHHGAPHPRHFTPNVAQPSISTRKQTPRAFTPTSLQEMDAFEDYRQASPHNHRFETLRFPEVWQRVEDDSAHSPKEWSTSHNQRPSNNGPKHRGESHKSSADLCWEADSDNGSVDKVRARQVRKSVRTTSRKVKVQKRRDPSPAPSISDTDSSVRSCSLSEPETPQKSKRLSVKLPTARSHPVAVGDLPSGGREWQHVESVVTGPLFFNRESMTFSKSTRTAGSMAEFSQALAELQEFSSRTPAVPSEMLRDVKITETEGPHIEHKVATKDKIAIPLMRKDVANLMSKDECHAVVTPVKHGARQLLEELIGQQTWAVPGRPVIYRYFLERAVQTEMPATQKAFQTLILRDANRTGTSLPHGRQQQRAFFCGDAQRLAEVIASPFGFAGTYEAKVLLFAFDLRHAEALSASCNCSPCDCGGSAAPKFGGRTLVAELALGNCHTSEVSLQDALKSAVDGCKSGAVPMQPAFEAAYRSGADSLYFPQPGVFAILDPVRALPQYLVEYRRDRSNMSSTLCGSNHTTRCST